MTTAAVARNRLADVLPIDRAVRTSAPRAETYSTSSGTYGSTLYGWLAGMSSDSVSESQALRVGAVFACVSLIGGAIAALPFHLYRKSNDGRERINDDVWWLLNQQMSAPWSSVSGWRYVAQSILLQGDGFLRIERAGRHSPRVIALHPYHPSDVVVKRVDGRNAYVMTDVDADGTQRRRVLDQDDVLHFPGVGFNGLRSVTPITAALGSAAGIASAADRHAASFFRGGARPDMAIVVPADQKTTVDQKELIRDSWQESRRRYTETGVPPLLVGGMDIKQITLNAKDAQLLETRQQSVEDIARIFGVPPHMIAKTDAQTSWGSGIEQMSIGFVRYTVGNHLDSIREEINRKLWPRSNTYGEHNRDALLEGDSTAQSAYFSKALGGPGAQGWMTVNEVRRYKNLPPVAGGDQLVWAGQQTNKDTANA